jgi:hypothetical protein
LALVDDAFLKYNLLKTSYPMSNSASRKVKWDLKMKKGFTLKSELNKPVTYQKNKFLMYWEHMFPIP